MSVDQAVREEQAIRQVTERLTKAFTLAHSPRDITRTVTAIHHRFDGRPIRDFVPVDALASKWASI